MRWWFVLAVSLLALVALARAESDAADVWEEESRDVLERSPRAAKDKDACKYSKGAWSDCDPNTNMKTRTLTLKKGDQNSCEKVKTIQKKCKKGNNKHVGKTTKTTSGSSSTQKQKHASNNNKNNNNKHSTKKASASAASSTLPVACRYEKGAWSECNIGLGEMSRTDKLKPDSDAACEPAREITKKCKVKKGTKSPKSTNKGGRRNRQ